MFQVDVFSYANGRAIKGETIEPFDVQFKKLPTHIIDKFKQWQQFLCFCFSDVKKVYLYSSSFEKEFDNDNYGNRYVRSVTLIVDNKLLKGVIRDGREIVFMGDVAIKNGVAHFQITTFNIVPKFDKGYCVTVRDNVRICYDKSDIDRSDSGIPDVAIEYLIDSNPVNNIKEVQKVFLEWERYIDFREKYLKTVGQRLYALNGFPEIIPIKSKSVEEADANEIVIPEELRIKGNDDGEKELFVYADKNEANVDYVLKVVVRIEHEDFLEEKKVIQQLKSFVRNGLELRAKGQKERKNVFFIGDGKEALCSRVGKGEWESLDFSEIENSAMSEIKKAKEELKKIFNNEIENELSEFKRSKLSRIIDEKVKEFRKNKKVEIENDSEIQKSVDNQIRIDIEELQKKCDKEKRFFNKPEEIEEEYNAKIQQIKNERDLRILQKQAEKLKEYTDKYRKLEESNIIEVQKQALKDAKSPNYSQQEINIQNAIKADAEQKKEAKQKAEAARLFPLFFRIDDQNPEILNKYKGKELVLAYDDRAEKVKIDRQKKSLAQLKKGKVKNPAMAQWLFDAQQLSSTEVTDIGEIEWQLHLNDIQKEAVRKVLASNSIFLLQGPPGTGKTQVIAEMTAQFVLRGKKVVIASETHKAIDNALERIPDIPAIRRLRINSRTNKHMQDNNALIMYNRERLSDNFYDSILNVGEKSISGYKHYKEDRDEFEKRLLKLNRNFSALAELQEVVKPKKQQIVELRRHLTDLKSKKDELFASIKTLGEHLVGIRRQLNSIEKYRVVDNDGEAIARLWSDIDIVKRQYGWITADLKSLVELDIDRLRREAVELKNPSEALSVKEGIERIKNEMEQLRDEDGENPQEGSEYYERFKELQTTLREMRQKEKNLGRGSHSDMLIFKVFSSAIIEQKEKLDSRIEVFVGVQDQIKLKIEEAKNVLREEESGVSKSIEETQNQYDKILQQIASIDEQKRQIEHDDEYNRYEDEESDLKRELSIMYDQLNIAPEERTFDVSAIKKLEDKRKIMDNDFVVNKEKYEKRRVIYDEIKGYIDGDVKEHDREVLTQELVKLCNVFGITSSGDNKEKEPDEANCIDLLKQDIDVVIIDEVSKSSFIDLLRPILYGKQVVLVGDHKQLPPMYDLKHLKDEEIETFDIEFDNGEVFSKAINKKFTTLVETCFFETLFRQLNDSYKITLNKQYRFHSDIMKVNPFYKNMRLGYDGQDGDKAHGLSIVFGANKVVAPSDHVCFIDCCDGFESSEENSNSLKNDREASVVVALLDKIADCTDKLSVGVICTYGLQAGAIKKRLKSAKYNLKRRLNRTPRVDEPFIVSTVDDFQGDERDIIILSMVRNPQGWRKKEGINLDFIRDYRRINVAITRPRKLLIVVGAKDFLSSEKTMISVDGIPGRISVFRDIINQGHLSSAEDIVGKFVK